MGGDSIRLPALQAKAIQATLFSTGMSLQAQKEGFTKLAAAADYATVIEGGLAAAKDKIKQNPDKIFRFVRAAVKGVQFFVTKRQSKLTLRTGFSDDKTLQAMINDMIKITKVQRDVKVGDVFELAYVKKVNDELKAAGWKP